MGYAFAVLPEPEDEVIATCSRCKGEIYSSEQFAADEERVLCSDCLDADFVQLPLWAKAQLMGMEVRNDQRLRVY